MRELLSSDNKLGLKLEINVPSTTVKTKLLPNSQNTITTSSLLDHVYTNVPNKCSNIKISSNGASSHDVIMITRTMKNIPKRNTPKYEY